MVTQAHGRRCQWDKRSRSPPHETNHRVCALISAEAAVKALADVDYFSPQDAFALAMWIKRVEPVLLAARKRNCPSQSCSALRSMAASGRFRRIYR